MTMYSCRDVGWGVRVVKWSDDLDVEAVYHLERRRGGRYSCECASSGRFSCRHREMVPLFIARDAMETGAFLDYDHAKWKPSLRRLLWPTKRK